jgi:hypothetical protein
LNALLRRGGVDLVYFNHLPVESAFYRQVRERTGCLCRNHFPVIEPHWRMVVPRTMEEFYASRSRKHRKHLRQYQNALERQFPNQIEVRTYRKPEDLARAIQDAAAISKNTYQAAMGVGFADDVRRRHLLRTAAEKGWFRGHILYLNGEPAAFRFALCYNGVYFGDGIGYDARWKQLRVGTILFAKVLERLCGEEAVEYYDFGFGDAEYKRSYADESWLEAVGTYIFAFRPYPIAINMLNGVNGCVMRGLTWALGRSGISPWIKRTWRRRLTKTDTASPEAES